ncbi:putative tos1 protein [Rosellinia necatrix]|uniref:glucan endo-1,3-beta-D-glucosidase n=1 Tax=Rosellinia necatrix TaxID=77044 RepID=A0A1S7UML3_ROSNE|nr:putative tos1 protein [Rosellinia necatrix]
MRYASAVLVGSAASVVSASAFCADAVQDAIGNFFCPGGVKQIKYGGLDIPGTYRAVASMDNSGTCTFEDRTYSGPIAPYDEGLSMHFRGPIQLANVAVYTPGKGKRDAPKVTHSKRHGHQHLHKKHHEQEEKRNVGDVVVATINGQAVSWINTWAGPTADAAADAAPAAVTSAAYPASSSTSKKPTTGNNVKTPADSTSITGDFVRSAYYDAASGVADGLVFLANVGSPGVSGTWDTVWGSSLAYVNEEGAAAAASPTVLKNKLLDDTQEIAIFSDAPCDESCGATRPDSVAYKGFEGASKVFVVELTMPDSGKSGAGQNMPAYWLLNAAIPRTAQYASCSCWKGDNESPLQGGCGELDVVEILSPGDTRAKSTFHFANGVGDSHYIDRPVNGPMTVAVVMDAASSVVSIKVLDSFDFSPSLTSAQVQDMVNDEKNVNLFSLMSFA